MKKIILSAAVAVAVSAGPAFAADLLYRKAPVAAPAPPSMFDIAFGAAIASDYNFRGISQSDRGASVYGYIEPRFNITPNIQLYAGIGGYSTKLPTSPSGEIDIYGGIRPTFGPLSFDFGVMYYYYPRETQLFYADPLLLTASPTNFGFGAFTLANTDFWEVYGKVSYTFMDVVTLGAAAYYSPSWLNTGAEGTYISGTVKVAAPSTWMPTDFGAYASGELARYMFGTPDPFFTLPFTDYTYWNLGIALTYKVFTLDFRYHDTDLNSGQCFALTGDPRGVASLVSNWCGDAFIVRLSVDSTLSAHK